MSKFGLYFGSKPSQVYEGDGLIQDGDTVKVVDQDNKVTAVIRLQPGSSVRKMTDAEMSEHQAPHASRTRSTSRGGPQSWMS